MRNCRFLRISGRAWLLGCLFISTAVHAQVLTNSAGEFPVIGNWAGDQTQSKVSFNSGGGWVVWQDNTIDGDGFGIGARHLDGTLSGDLAVFRVNQIGAGQQEKPQVTMLKDGGAAFVWQGGRIGFQKIWARFMTEAGTFFSGNEFIVNDYTNQYQIDPAIACLNNSNVVVTWSSAGQDGSRLGVFGRLLSPTGQKLGSEFQVNQTTNFNQRSSAVAALNGGGFAVVWVSEISRTSATNELAFTVEVMARLYNSSGTPGDEFLVSAGTNICANPAITATSDGGFIVAWSQNDTKNRDARWDVFAKAYNAGGSQKGNAFRVNTDFYGDEFTPAIASSGTNCFIVWTALGQDGSYEGVYGQAFNINGDPVGNEMRVNTTTISKQMYPSLGADENGRYLASWSSYVGNGNAFDLYAQRFATGDELTLPAPSTPYVSAVSSNALSVTWPELAGYSVAFYEIYVDSDSSPIVTAANYTLITNLTPSSTHSIGLLYQLTDGRRSPLSAPATGRTWGVDANNDGLPDDWQIAHWGSNPANWPGILADNDGDGANNLMEFLAGTDPNDTDSVLRTQLIRTQQGAIFAWNTQPGLIYQVQTASVLNSWQNVGLPRFAHGTVDAVNVGGGGQLSFYRVILLR